MIKQFHANQARRQRHRRLRRHLLGTGERPRLSVFRSTSHMYAQIIDDETGRTLVAASSREPLDKDGLRPQQAASDKAMEGIKGIENNHKVADARLVGRLLAERARGQDIRRVVFDRGGYGYHGRVAALAVGAREGGLDF